MARRNEVFEKMPNSKQDPRPLDIIKDDLSYQDAALTKEEKQEMLERTIKWDSARKYADSIIQLCQGTDLETIRKQARKLVTLMESEADRIGVPVSPYGKSCSWAMWDIGKQNYFFTHQAENNSAYEIGDPLSDTKREEIINRHLGWEAYKAFHSDPAPGWKQKITNDRRYIDALELLNKPPNQFKTLSSKDLAELGKYLRQRRD